MHAVRLQKALSAGSLASAVIGRGALEALGWWQTIGAAVGADVLSWLFALGCGALGIWFGVEWAHDLRRGDAPDYQKWDKEKVFTLGEAACLWCDQEPTQRLSFLPKREFRKMARDIDGGELDNDLVIEEYAAWRKEGGDSPEWKDRPVNVNTVIGRSALTAYAKKRGEQPPFLFVGARG